MPDFSERPSHVGPDGPVALEEHLTDVRDRVRLLVPEDAETPAGNSLRELAEAVALVHDAGKLTGWFRDHLLGDREVRPDGPTHHAPLGAVLAHYVLSARGFDGSDPLLGFLAVAKHHGRLPDTATYVSTATADPADSRLHSLFREDVHEQAEHIDDEVPALAADLVDRATDGAGSWAAFRSELRESEEMDAYITIAEHVCEGRRLSPQPERLPDGFYGAVLQAWSALVFADKTGAVSLSSRVDIDADAYASVRPRRGAIDDHIATLRRRNATADLDARTEEMNRERESARREVRRRAEQFAASDRRIATLTLPTGMGKTLSGLDAALTVLRERSGESRQPTGDGRLVYALPYTSIIDQVAEQSVEVFGEERVTVDHHLAETLVPTTTTAEEVPDDQHEEVAAMLGESWRSGMVVTTFVQLFESLAGPANSRSMKLPSLYGSVVVLDEPQALPLSWWPLVDRLVELLTTEYGATVVTMTATQPKLLTEDGREPFSLVENPEPYYEGLDRLDFELHPSVVSLLPDQNGDDKRDTALGSGGSDQNDSTGKGSEETVATIGYDCAGELLAERVGDGTSVLAICNTIDSARELADTVATRTSVLNVNKQYAEHLAEVGGETESAEPSRTVERVLRHRNGEPLLLHLTTRHRPCDRRHLIRVATELAETGEPVLFVSTQLVEAGVDVSFDEVIRDFAPMDSLVQAAGRCNRSFDRDRGRVTVWHLAPPEGRETTPASAVYARGESLTKLTATALGSVYDGGPMPESIVTRDAVECYFEALDGRGVGTNEYVEYLERGETEQLGNLSLIDERPAVDVVVARTTTERETVERIRTAYSDSRWDELDSLVEDTADWQVSVPVYPGDEETGEKLRACESLFPDADRLVLDGRPGRDGGYFDATNGVVIPDTSVEARLL